MGANILIPTGQTVPDEVRARLLVDGTVLDSLTGDDAPEEELDPGYSFDLYEGRRKVATVEVLPENGG